MSSDTKRLFLAIKINPESSLLQLISRFRNSLAGDKINWVRPENIHLTLKFLGETPVCKIPGIEKIITEIASQNKSFTTGLKGIGAFGSRYQPRVVWAGFSEPESMLNLGESCLNTFHKYRFYRDRQNFIPHLTLGRIHEIRDKKRFWDLVEAEKETTFQQVEVKKLILFESILLKTGPVYHELFTIESGS